MPDKKIFSLLEVALSIRKTLADRYQSSFWVKAEINKLNFHAYSGHCYPDLVEKRDGKVIAQLKSNLWKSDFERVNGRFLAILKEPLKDGISVLLCAAITFDANYGLSLRIIDIDPAFSLGELEREKQEAIQTLKAENIFDRNRQLTLPLLPQRIALISADTSKGYSDYLKILDQNPWGYKFFNFLFPAILQGDNAVTTILSQLARIRKVLHHFDAVAIVRGGGGDVGLSSYNSLELAREISVFPIPVITGIGHSTNETVAEMVAYQNAITPTELADFLIQKFHEVATPVKRAEETIVARAARILNEENLRLMNSARYFYSVVRNDLIKSRHQVDESKKAVARSAIFRVRQDEAEIARQMKGFQKFSQSFLAMKGLVVDALEKNIALLSPESVLRRGFSITLDENGKALTHRSQINIGQTITTRLRDFQINSTVSKKTEDKS